MAASEKQTLKSGHTISLADGHGLMNWWEIASNDWLTDWQLINWERRSTDWKSNRLICLLFDRLTGWLPGTLNKWMTNLLPGNWMTDCTAHWQTDQPTKQSIENWLNPLYIDFKTPWQRAVKLSLYKSNQLENPRVFLFSCFWTEYNFSWLWRRFRFKMSWVLFSVLYEKK